MDLFQVLAQTDPIQLLASKGGHGLTLTVSRAEFAAPIQEIAGYLFRVSLAVRLLIGQDVPDHHQQFAGNSHNSLLFAHAGG